MITGRCSLLYAIVAVYALSGDDSVAGQTPARYELQPELRIDGYAHDLVSIPWFGVAPNGTMALVQRQDRGIRFFDRSGNDLGVFGREGKGPGEFVFIGTIGWLGDTLWVSDVRLRRITYISPDRTLLRTSPLRPARAATEDAANYPRYAPAGNILRGVYGDGSLLVYVIAPDPGRLLRVDPDGVIQEILLQAAPELAAGVRINAGKGRMTAAIPFAPQAILAVSPNGLRLGAVVTYDKDDSPSYLVTLATWEGDTIYSRSYQYQRVRVQQEALDSILHDISTDPLWNRVPGDAVRNLIEEVRRLVPEYMAPVIGMFIGDDGRAWIELQPTDNGRPWLILDGRGDVVARVLAKANVRLRAADQIRAWGIETDSLNVQSLVRYRLRLLR